MNRWKMLLAAMAASAGLCVLTGPVIAATDATKAPVRNLAADPNAKDLILKGDAKCTGCHDEADEPTGAATMLELNPGVLSIGKTKHGTRADSRTPTCVDCHGESEKHVQHKGSDKPPKVDRSFRKNTPTSAEVRNQACMTCHQSGKRIHWQSSAHASNDVACTSCHSAHAKNDKVRDKRTQAEVCYTCHKQQRVEGNRPSRHPISEGKMACSDCHNSHGSTGEKALVKETVNATCFTCHAEKRGPFIRNHSPVQENCAICHNPHGTTTQGMLRARVPFLCQQCHESSQHRGNMPSATIGSLTNEQGRGTVLGQGCITCHTVIHGSNSTSSTGSLRH
jgi:DmsE family decaheme c-type cytochrome